MKNLIFIIIIAVSVNVFSQTGIDTLIVKERDWKIIGEILASDEKTVTFRPKGSSKIRTVSNNSIKEIRFCDGSVQYFDKKASVKNYTQKTPSEKSDIDSQKVEPDVPKKKESLFVTDIFDDFMLLLNNGELIKLHGLKEIKIMDSKKPPEYIRNQTYLYIVENLGGKLIELEYINEETPIKEAIIYSESENFNQRAIKEGYAEPEKGTIFYKDKFLSSAETAKENNKGIWGKEGIDLAELRKRAIDKVQSDSDQSESQGLNLNNPFMNLFQNIADKFISSSSKMDGAPGKGVVNQYTESLKILGMDTLKNLPNATMKDIMKKHNLKYPEKGAGKKK